MHKADIGIAPEGWPCIGLAALAAEVFALADFGVSAVLCLAACAFSLHFFRDPERVVPQGPGVAVSPADGRILHVAERADPVTGESRLCVAVFMNVFNVHVNRVPVAGTVEEIQYRPGKFFNASLDKASEDNERCAYSLRDADGNTWTMVQIAGLIARRIVCRVEQGDSLNRGERFGLIRFGSRVDLYLPRGYVVAVRPGECVFAGQSIIAHKN
jgi:phosphatidylserine decarboxylase